MKSTGIFLVGYTILVGGVVAALWKSGFVASVGTGWTAIGVVIAVGVGIMIAVASNGRKDSIVIGKP